MSGSNEEFDFTTKAPQQIQSGTILVKARRLLSVLKILR